MAKEHTTDNNNTGNGTVITLPAYLKYQRVSRGLSQEYVAEILHITRQAYSHYETERVVPPVNNLFALATLYDIPAEDIIRIAEADYKRSNGDNSFSAIDDPDSWMDDIRVDFEVRPKDIEAYNAFIESNRNRYCKLRRDEKCCLFYYNSADSGQKASVITLLKTAVNRPE